MKDYYIYILTNKMETVLYIGITSNLPARIYQHQNKITQGFTQKYNLNKLIYFEQYSDPENAILREKQLKKWSRVKKENLIKKTNPSWNDLAKELNLL